ncbi:hypothetical protein B4O97_03275 [Marispirochaeta aestuarii]|uniref:Ribosome maturation factor RimP n=2 Tax=Marispirochaeta aestuarii TaxID=1963862 RepID=A0A1Y1S2R5_9SPIO|nr:hypothetical protein B4O97_03275 [Marispirochaeta aestuarii]
MADSSPDCMKEGTGISPELESTVDIIQGMGFSVVEAQCRPVKGSVQVVIYIYSSEGVSLDDCTKVYRTVMPRLEVALDSRDISLEISSPGISRNIKFFREFAIFTGRRIRVLTEDSSEWVQGDLIHADDDEIVLTVGDGERRYGRAEIVKAKISEG